MTIITYRCPQSDAEYALIKFKTLTCGCKKGWMPAVQYSGGSRTNMQVFGELQFVSWGGARMTRRSDLRTEKRGLGRHRAPLGNAKGGQTPRSGPEKLRHFLQIFERGGEKDGRSELMKQP